MKRTKYDDAQIDKKKLTRASTGWRGTSKKGEWTWTIELLVAKYGASQPALILPKKLPGSWATSQSTVGPMPSASP